MAKLKKIFTVSLFYFALFSAYCQTDAISQNPISISSVVLDTVETKLNSTVMRMLWLNDTITVSIQNENIKIDTSYFERYRKVFKDSTLWRTKEDIDIFKLAVKKGGQNCYTYALEKYFQNNENFEESLFGIRSTIDRASAEKILNNYFKKIREIPTKPSKNLKSTIPNDVLLGFVNKNDWIIHFVYFQNDIFYSKNGAHQPIKFQSLKKFLKKHYWDTTKIILYKLDEVKIQNAYVNNGYK
ncbi:hypothetical protein [Zunongwangia sp. HRR-M8]|uniref:hypothetical protein n=1 Tax=Zunongwangia sp. HRR-M8 TaxID=3015170 RepID=UPI0022DDF47D|nr:hypothetical protein [Zunongwangia sp. HRR-M8]WBL23641.1 hypothetical protein PBT89_06710 [Zunongwangia sp. HRR-M8]